MVYRGMRTTTKGIMMPLINKFMVIFLNFQRIFVRAKEAAVEKRTPKKREIIVTKALFLK
jgi:hypothetical protein